MTPIFKEETSPFKHHGFLRENRGFRECFCGGKKNEQKTRENKVRFERNPLNLKKPHVWGAELQQFPTPPPVLKRHDIEVGPKKQIEINNPPSHHPTIHHFPPSHPIPPFPTPPRCWWLCLAIVAEDQNPRDSRFYGFSASRFWLEIFPTSSVIATLGESETETGPSNCAPWCFSSQTSSVWFGSQLGFLSLRWKYVFLIGVAIWGGSPQSKHYTCSRFKIRWYSRSKEVAQNWLEIWWMKMTFHFS